MISELEKRILAAKGSLKIGETDDALRHLEKALIETAPLLTRITELEAAIQKAASEVFDYHFHGDSQVALHQVSMDLEAVLKKADKP